MIIHTGSKSVSFDSEKGVGLVAKKEVDGKKKYTRNENHQNIWENKGEEGRKEERKSDDPVIFLDG